MTDEELQNKMEGGFTGNSPDDRAYRAIFDALKKEPGYKLSPDFASIVISRAKATQSSSKDFIWFYVGLGAFAIAMVVAIALTGFKLKLTGFKMDWGALKFISGYPGLVIFGILFIGFLQWIDKKLLRKATF